MKIACKKLFNKAIERFGAISCYLSNGVLDSVDEFSSSADLKIHT